MTASPTPLPPLRDDPRQVAVVTVAPSATPDLLAVSFEGPAVAGMLARYAGTLTLSGLDIVWAAIVPLPEAGVRHEFQVMPLRAFELASVQGDLQQLVQRAEYGSLDVAARLRDARAQRMDDSLPPVTVEIDLDSGITTGVRVKAPDRPGLLHDIALTISNFGYRTRSITVLTSGGIAHDTFRIVDMLGNAPTEHLGLASLRARLVSACR